MQLNHEHFMSLAILEAKKGLGFTSPNPAVGAVIVRNNTVISTGYHKKAGTNHAEREAILNAGDIDFSDTILYVTLEPCCHFGRTPPCTDLIIEKRIGIVIFGSYDTDERVKNKGKMLLEAAGIKVTGGVLQDQCDKLNSIYFFNKEYKRPYVILKAALTLDGKIATVEHDSKWISNEKSRVMVHKIRSRVSGIVCGGNTFRIDTPRLNCRLPGFENKQLKRIIFTDSMECGENDLLINKAISSEPQEFLNICLKNGIDSLLVEGGSDIYTWFLNNNLVDKIYLFYKPSFLGSDGIPVFKGNGVQKIADLKQFSIINTEIIDDNILMELGRGNTKYSLEL